MAYLRKHSRKRDRRAAALVEFAVCLPVLMILILGSMEASSVIFLKQSLHSAAYEGIRAAAFNKGTDATAMSAATNVLTARNIRSSRVTFTPASIVTAARGDRITVEVSASASANSPFMGRVIPDRQITVRLVMVKE